MKTLVIHPKDPTTDFLIPIYIGRGWTEITDPSVSKAALKRAIKEHDRIVMLGHGTGYGLLAMTSSWAIRTIIDSSFVDLLREKECVCIWCNANFFVKAYDLKGFYSGMIISEMQEADLYNIVCTEGDVRESNSLFTKAIKESICSVDMLSVAKSVYVRDTNPVVNYNKNNLYSTL